jgi:hypothetical protein
VLGQLLPLAAGGYLAPTCTSLRCNLAVDLRAA